MERWELLSNRRSPSLGEPRSWEQHWHLRWLRQVTPQLPPSVPKLLVVVAGAIPGGRGKSSSHASRRCRENENPNFFSLGEVPGSGRATLAVSLRVFCHQPNAQGCAAGASLSWNNFLWNTPSVEKPGVNFPGKAVGNEKCYKREAGAFLPSCIPRDQTDGSCPMRKSNSRGEKEAGDVLCGIAAPGITGDISSRARNAAGSNPS